ncbi:hypothetical protein GFD17_02795 [Bifidobacterium sp. SMB2]|uniref:Uncharacterized protein n=1 Tax=Bifidobacterium saimiriisciurei TaxID=2661627 RepID=A0ABX0CBB4_9BIFI|nr:MULTISPECIES: hypothetical protein [Bifidobacterium]NEG95698.1 hypothetical protein [Bifidobacterium sp. SMB2]NEH11125.1 hypothetical protein [Bifidobacterium saimiriisciurei]
MDMETRRKLQMQLLRIDGLKDEIGELRGGLREPGADAEAITAQIAQLQDEIDRIHETVERAKRGE